MEALSCLPILGLFEKDRHLVVVRCFKVRYRYRKNRHSLQLVFLRALFRLHCRELRLHHGVLVPLAHLQLEQGVLFLEAQLAIGLFLRALPVELQLDIGVHQCDCGSLLRIVVRLNYYFFKR